MIKINKEIKYEDTILIKRKIENLIIKKENVTINFCNKTIKTTILNGLFFDILNSYGIEIFEKYIKIININNKNDINRVIYGTTFINK